MKKLTQITSFEQNGESDKTVIRSIASLELASGQRQSVQDLSTELMILAAKTGRKYWEIAGTWKEVIWGEYRLAMTYLKSNDLVQSLEHSQICLEVAQENKASALEMFFGYEVLALVEKARDNSIGFSKAQEQAKIYFEKLSDQDKTWCESSLQKLTK